jgi:O-antigen ligase
LGTFRHAAGLDKPATGTAVLEQAHNDWLEWAATTGVLGCAILLVAVVGIALPLLPSHARRLRFEYRYPLAGAALALVTTGFHEVVGFGLQTPLNRYLLAAWVGLVWGVMATTSSSRRQGQGRRKQEEESSGEDSAEPGNERGEGELGGADVRV